MGECFAVTGAGGYLGSNIVRILLSRGARVRALTRSAHGAKSIPAGAEIVIGDLHDDDAIARLFDCGEDRLVVIHAAAVVSVARRDEEAYKTNAEGTKRIIDACKHHAGAKFVYVSSVDALGPCDADDGIVREPSSFSHLKRESAYARSKAEASQTVLDAAKDGLDAVVVMPSCLLGPGDTRASFTTTMLSVYLRGIPPVSIRGGFDFADVRDVAEAIIAAKDAPGGESFILSNQYLSVTDIFDILAEYTGRKRTKIEFATNVLYLVLPVTKLYTLFTKKRAPISSTAIRLLRTHPTFSHEKADRMLGYHARDMRESVLDTAKWMQQRAAQEKE